MITLLCNGCEVRVPDGGRVRVKVLKSGEVALVVEFVGTHDTGVSGVDARDDEGDDVTVGAASKPTALGEDAPPLVTTEEVAARRRWLAAQRQRRCRQKKRDMSRCVTQDVTPSRVTPSDCLVDCNINNINNLKPIKQPKQEEPQQKSVARDTSRRMSRKTSRKGGTREPPEGQLWLPIEPPLENSPHLSTPAIREAWKRWVRWRQTAKGVRAVSWDCYNDMLETLEMAWQIGREPSVLEVLEYGVRAARVNRLIIPPDAHPTKNVADDVAARRAAQKEEEDRVQAERDLEARLRAIGYVPDTRAWQRGKDAVEAEERRREEFVARLEELEEGN
ncbi:MAG: hypothetical protein Q4D38_12160 [Planctomycetia bacterium]|nr:hypothetical protein [Planctomycetia bacterium]